MSNSYLDTLQDEALRIEVGPAAASDLAVENLELSTPTITQAVRQSVISRRAERSVSTGLSRNRLAMHEVTLPPVRQPALEYCAA